MPVLLYGLQIRGISCSDTHLNIAKKTYTVYNGHVHAFLAFTPNNTGGHSHSQVRIP